jgi:hypothetical protein
MCDLNEARQSLAESFAVVIQQADYVRCARGET